MMAEREQRSAVVARVLMRRAERLTAVWRQVRFSEVMLSGRPWVNQLDGVVESYIQELGRTLSGEAGNPWSRTRGVLRLAPQRGPNALVDEFIALRRCLSDAVSMFGGQPADQAIVDQALQEAQESAMAMLEGMDERSGTGSWARFGGLVVRLYEQPSPDQARTTEGRATVH